MPDISKEKLTADELRRLRKANEEFGDIELQMDIAPNLGYQGPIDISKLRYHPIGGSNAEVTTKGFYVPPDDPNDPYTEKELSPYNVAIDGYKGQIPKEPGTVNIIGAKSATPEVLSHEYRHLQGLKNETENRLADAAMATNERQWKFAVDMWRDALYRDGVLKTPSEAERDLISKLHGWSGSDTSGAAHREYRRQFDKGAKPTETHWYEPDNDQYAKEQTKLKYWDKRSNELNEFDSWVEDLAKRNEERDR